MEEILDNLYREIEDTLPLRMGNARQGEMEKKIRQTMGEDFMEQYDALCYEQDRMSRVDLFHYALALGIRLGNLADLR